MARTIGIISIKGGVGKTSAVVALGAVLAKDFGKKVLLVDANFSAPNLGLHLGVVNPEVTLHHVLTGKANIAKAIYKTAYDFSILPGALMYNKVNPFSLKNKLNQIKDDYDVILIDSSPTLNEEILATMVASDELLVVTTPDHVTLSTTLRAVKLAKQKKTPISGLILNKMHNKGFELKLEDIEEASNTNVLAVIPYEMNSLEALSKCIPSPANKTTGAAIEYRKLAAALIGQTYKDPRLKARLKAVLWNTLDKPELNRRVFVDPYVPK